MKAMTLGKGLESLIPKKEPFLKENVVSPERDESRLGPHAGSIVQGSVVPSDDEQEEDVTVPSNDSPVIDRFNIPKTHLASQPFVAREKLVERYPQLKQESVFHIEVEKIKPNPYQPRREFNKENLIELAQSIREFGIIQPIVVTKMEREAEHGTEVEYQLIAGERRLMASRLAGLERVPAIIKRVDEKRTKLELALIENVQRSNLNPIEAAKAYARLQDEFNLTQREIAARVGKSREAVANTIRLLNLPSLIQDALSQGKLNESQARTLLTISNMEEQNRVFQNILNKGMSVRALREEAQKPTPADPESQYWEKKLEEILGAPVKLVRSGGRGKMVVQFYSEEEWRGILDKLLGENHGGDI